jgi:hypothetical protein
VVRPRNQIGNDPKLSVPVCGAELIEYAMGELRC